MKVARSPGIKTVEILCWNIVFDDNEIKVTLLYIDESCEHKMFKCKITVIYLVSGPASLCT
jgi:hypothetical protein